MLTTTILIRFRVAINIVGEMLADVRPAFVLLRFDWLAGFFFAPMRSPKSAGQARFLA